MVGVDLDYEVINDMLMVSAGHGVTWNSAGGSPAGVDTGKKC